MKGEHFTHPQARKRERKCLAKDPPEWRMGGPDAR